MDLKNASIFDAKNIGYEYPGNISALSSLDFTIGEGERVALVGANGCGKSTLLKLLDGLIFPRSGELYAFGRLLTEKTLEEKSFTMEFRSRVGMVFQDPDVQLFSSRVWDEVLFGPLQLEIPKEEAIARGAAALELLGVAHLKERPPYLLSGGEKKKVAIASVISLHPQVLLLDEPAAGLDPRSQGRFIDFLLEWAGEKSCLIFSTQDLDFVDEVATRMIVLGEEHTILADAQPEEILADRDFLLGANLLRESSRRRV